MFNFLKFKKQICKLLTCWLPKRYRKDLRNFLFWFSLTDFFRFKNQNFYIVSLGKNCLPRILTTSIKLKPRKFYGEKSLPFDLCVTEIDRVINLIQNDFANFFDIKITKENFPHDYKLDYEKFYRRYSQRIKNFRSIMNSDKMIYFIYADFEKQEIKNLYDVLKQKRGQKPFKLICLNSQTINNSNVIQITSDFKITDSDWGVRCINQYKEFDDKYTRFCQNMHCILSEIIK